MRPVFVFRHGFTQINTDYNFVGPALPAFAGTSLLLRSTSYEVQVAGMTG